MDGIWWGQWGGCGGYYDGELYLTLAPTKVYAPTPISYFPRLEGLAFTVKRGCAGQVGVHVKPLTFGENAVILSPDRLVHQ